MQAAIGKENRRSPQIDNTQPTEGRQPSTHAACPTRRYQETGVVRGGFSE